MLEKQLVFGIYGNTKDKTTRNIKIRGIFFREKLVTVRSNRLIDELFVFIYNGNR